MNSSGVIEVGEGSICFYEGHEIPPDEEEDDEVKEEGKQKGP